MPADRPTQGTNSQRRVRRSLAALGLVAALVSPASAGANGVSDVAGLLLLE
ncbi:MAG: hypothetical protein HY906_22740 [Deltaproteobacteria bacterium]|nr:hypothetical protein [Deltaproteobacteria bacterium]